MLDLLRVGGRCAVIIPEGVLFGNTDAHVRLRRELLSEHVVEGVISLPGGVFQPYTGVKTSILIFRKETRRDDKQTFTRAVAPRTEYVWFYEVEKDGYSDNAKRNPRFLVSQTTCGMP
jgi:type I restriction enzyme M protein